MKRAIAIITMIAVGLTVIACGSQPTPDVGSRGTPAPSTTIPASDSVGAGTQGPQSQGGTGGATPKSYDAHVSSARIMFGGGIGPAAYLLVATPCNSLISPRLLAILTPGSTSL